MSNDLPRFRKYPFDMAHSFASAVLTNPHRSPKTYLRKLVPQEDKHFRAFFAPEYFALAEGETEPSRSQWSSLKKKLKRHDRRVFVFKDHGSAQCDGKPCYYVDFGFFAD